MGSPIDILVGSHNSQLVEINLAKLYNLKPRVKYRISLRFKPNPFRREISEESNEIFVEFDKPALQPALSTFLIDPVTGPYKRPWTENP